MQKEPIAWTEELRRAFRDPLALAEHLGIPLSSLPELPIEPDFPFLVPRPFVARMRPGDPSDPLLRQVWPDRREAIHLPHEMDDPVGDDHARKCAGVLQKYEGRVLLVTTGACALACRYCFRQNYGYEDTPHSDTDWDAIFEDLAGDTRLREAILSGGDPLTRTDSVIARWVARIEAIPHIETLRIHTRLPVAIPSRVTPDLCSILDATRLRIVVVVHINHSAEIDESFTNAMSRLRGCGATLMNQSVLLKDVNDTADQLESLSFALWRAGVLPYYLHALDPVRGSSRFRVPDHVGVELVDEIRRRLPGYLVPRLVREIMRKPSKTPLG